MKAALRTLVELDTDGRRVAVLGQMSELGEESERRHREVGEAAAALGVDELIAVGAIGAEIARAAQGAGLRKSTSVAKAEEAAALLGETAEPGDLILIKGSRSARMERVLEAFSKRQPAAEVAP